MPCGIPWPRLVGFFLEALNLYRPPTLHARNPDWLREFAFLDPASDGPGSRVEDGGNLFDLQVILWTLGHHAALLGR